MFDTLGTQLPESCESLVVPRLEADLLAIWSKLDSAETYQEVGALLQPYGVELVKILPVFEQALDDTSTSDEAFYRKFIAAWAIAEIALKANSEDNIQQENLHRVILPHCIKMTNSDDRDVQAKALLALSAMAPNFREQVVPVLTSVKAESQLDLRLYSLYGLLKYNEKVGDGAISTIAEAIGADPESLPLDPILILAKLDRPQGQFLPYIFKRAKENSELASLFLEAALGVAEAGNAAFLAPCLKALKSEDPLSIRIATIVLRKINTPDCEVQQLLEELIRDGVPSVRTSAERALSHLSNSSEFKTIKEFSTGDPVKNYSVEILSARAESDYTRGVEQLLKTTFPELSVGIADYAILDTDLYPTRVYIVREQESGKIVASVQSNDDSPGDSKVVTIYSLAVAEEYRGKGIARELLKSVEKDVVNLGYKQLARTCVVDNGWAATIEKNFQGRIIEKEPTTDKAGRPRVRFLIQL